MDDLHMLCNSSISLGPLHQGVYDRQRRVLILLPQQRYGHAIYHQLQESDQLYTAHNSLHVSEKGAKDYHLVAVATDLCERACEQVLKKPAIICSFTGITAAR